MEFDLAGSERVILDFTSMPAPKLLVGTASDFPYLETHLLLEHEKPSGQQAWPPSQHTPWKNTKQYSLNLQNIFMNLGRTRKSTCPFSSLWYGCRISKHRRIAERVFSAFLNGKTKPIITRIIRNNMKSWLIVDYQWLGLSLCFNGFCDEREIVMEWNWQTFVCI